MKDVYFLEISSEESNYFPLRSGSWPIKPSSGFASLYLEKPNKRLLINLIILMKLINLFIIISNLLNEEALSLRAICLKSPGSLYCPCLRIISSLIVNCVLPCILFGEFADGLCLMEGASDCKVSVGVCSWSLNESWGPELYIKVIKVHWMLISTLEVVSFPRHKIFWFLN